MANEIQGFRYIGQGYCVVPVGKHEGVAMNITEPKQMIALMANPQKIKETIVVTPGGTTTFVAPLLYRKPAGIITYAGTPESHLGIVGRNFRVPIIMTLKLEGMDAIPDGTRLLMECEGKLGRVYVKVEAGAQVQPEPGSILG
jgi:phosphohistidine swiveling domain-containing protein